MLKVIAALSECCSETEDCTSLIETEAKHTRGYAVSECLRVKAVTEIKVSTKAQG